MTVCNDCGDTLVEVWRDKDGYRAIELCPDCFFAALTIRHRGTGRESGAVQPSSETRSKAYSAPTAAAKFLCPSCHAKKDWPLWCPPEVAKERGWEVICKSCYTYAQEHAERALAREDEMEGYVDRR